jgi:hypothetical protein
VAAVLLLAIVATVAATQSSSSGSPSATSSTQSPEDQLVSALNNATTHPDFQQVSNSTLARIGDIVCLNLSGGMAVADDFQSLSPDLSLGMNSNDLGYLMAAAVHYICPQFSPKVVAWTNASGSSPSAPSTSPAAVVPPTTTTTTTSPISIAPSTDCTNVTGDSDLAGCDLSGGNYAGAQLNGDSFAEANLRGVDFAGTSLADSNFYGANLSNANLTNAILGGASLTNTNLTGANLSGDTALADSPPEGATWSHTICPDNTNSDADGGTCINNLRPPTNGG